MELTDNQTVFLPLNVHWKNGEIYFFLDPEAPHWIATDSRGSQLVSWLQEGFYFGEMIRRYASLNGVGAAKAWLHVHDFVQALLRSGFATAEPFARSPYLGRAAYAKPDHLKELWFHTNNICNLSCTHCLVGSAPWVKDWGLPTERFLELIDEAVKLGVKRFYFTGGEPFMRRDIFTLIRAITEEQGCELIILTNATLFSDSAREEGLAKLKRDKVRFQVSLDGASPETNDPIRGEGSFHRTVRGLQLLVEMGFETSLTTVVTASNLKELPALTRLCHEWKVTTQHLMWLHHRGRAGSNEYRSAEVPGTLLEKVPGTTISTWFPPIKELISAVRQVKQVADELGVHLDNWESIKQRVNGRPGVKYDLGNACWDSLCIYSDGVVYPSAALANIPSLALGDLMKGMKGARSKTWHLSLREIWESSPIAQAFREASVVHKEQLRSDPFRYLTGGGDLEHSFSFNLNGDSPQALTLDRIRTLITGTDPYHPLYTALMKEAMEEWARQKKEAVNRRSGYDVPRIFHAMGDGAIHCATDDLVVDGPIDVRTLHSNCVLAFDVDKPRRLVREFYGKAAETPKAELCCPTQFDSSLVDHIPQEVVDRFYGCGSPVTLGNLRAGEILVDLGSGAGIDCFIAAKFVGPTGRVIGVDMTDEMLGVANRSRPIVAENLGYDVVAFRKGYLESVPVESKSVDLVTSNCVINLSPDKPKVFAEVWRVLKDHGRMVVADIVSTQPVPVNLKVNPELWGECIVGALTEEEFLARLEEAGFYGLSILKKAYWKTVEGFDFYSVTVQGYKFEKSAAAPGEVSSNRSQSAGCRFIGQKAIYLGPMKSVLDEEGHLFPRNVAVEICTDTAAKLSQPPYAGSFAVIQPDAQRADMTMSAPSAASGCDPGCC